jgi:hypothetical protein
MLLETPNIWVISPFLSAKIRSNLVSRSINFTKNWWRITWPTQTGPPEAKHRCESTVTNGRNIGVFKRRQDVKHQIKNMQ